MPKTKEPTNGEDRCQVKVIHADRVEKARRDEADEGRLYRLAALYKALGDPTRLRLVTALLGGEMCVCDLAAYLGCTDSAVSHHLRRLKDLALVRPRREGQMLFYSLDDDHVADILAMGLAHIEE